RVLVYIDAHLDEPLGLEDLARVAHISPFHFHRIFRSVMGKTLQTYVKQLRLEAAEGMLRYSDRPITEIGLSIGYESHAAFSKMFRQLIRLSPTRYREHMRPLVETMLKRTQSDEKTIQPKFITRQDEEVLFIRRVGDYQKSPYEAFDALFLFLKDEGLLQH